MWRGRGFGYGRGFWGFGPGPGWGRGNPTLYCRAYPWLPRGWWAYSNMSPWATTSYGAQAPGSYPWNPWYNQGFANPYGYRW